MSEDISEDTLSPTRPGLSAPERNTIRDAFLSSDSTVELTKRDGELLSLLSIFGPQPRSRIGVPSDRGQFFQWTEKPWYRSKYSERPQSAVGDVLIHCGMHTLIGNIRLVSRIKADIEIGSTDKPDPSIGINTVKWSRDQPRDASPSGDDWLKVSQFKVPDRDQIYSDLPRWSLVHEEGDGILQQDGGQETEVKITESVHLELANLRLEFHRC